MAEVMYDCAEWHHPELGDLPNVAAATHVGMFTVWAWLESLGSERALDEYSDAIEAARRREIAPGAMIDDLSNGSFDEDDLNVEGNRFAGAYYLKNEDINVEPGGYIHDYLSTFAAYKSLFDVPDTWESFDRIAPIISARFHEWRAVNKTN